MRSRRTRLLVALAGGLVVFPVLAGCQTQAPPLSKREESNFQGGPMPEDARRIMQQKMREAQNKNARPSGQGGTR